MLKVNEIFYSIQGESTYAGIPCIFVRLTGCNARCVWCDTEYSFYEGTRMGVDEVLEEVSCYPCRTIEITGGEPLLQKEVHKLIAALLERGYRVMIETSGTVSVAQLDPRVIKVMDLKCPDSGECQHNDYTNLEHLTSEDQVKFVIASRRDYEWAKEALLNYRLAERVPVLFSPVYQVMDPATLAGWILEDGLPVRLQLQLHKVIWGDKRGV